MIKDLLRNRPQAQTVFTLNEIAQLTGKPSDADLISQIHYYVKKGELVRLSKGIYALDRNYAPKELGNKLRTPSYISLYTVLQEAGMVFQPYTSIFLVASRSEQMAIDGHKFVYRKVKNAVLLNILGIVDKVGVSQATPERALADKIYLDGMEHIDNVRNINWDFLSQLNAAVYKSKTIEGYIKSMRE